jgi:HPt (histidine-containing phosphotransfer) domain-containing protein
MSADVIDRAMLDDMVEHLGVAAFRPVIDLFLDESRRYVAIIRQGDAEAARRAAHSLKSSAGQLGAAALSAAAAEIERLAAGGMPLADRAAALDALLAETATALAALLGR